MRKTAIMSNPSIFVQPIPSHMDWRYIHDIFSEWGRVSRVIVKPGNSYRGDYAIVHFERWFTPYRIDILKNSHIKMFYNSSKEWRINIYNEKVNEKQSNIFYY